MVIARPKSKKQQYVQELQDMVRRRFPDAQFDVSRMPDTRTGTAIWTYTSADPEDVDNLVVDRELELMIDHGMFIYVIPMPLEALKDSD